MAHVEILILWLESLKLAPFATFCRWSPQIRLIRVPIQLPVRVTGKSILGTLPYIQPSIRENFKAWAGCYLGSNTIPHKRSCSLYDLRPREQRRVAHHTTYDPGNKGVLLHRMFETIIGSGIAVLDSLHKCSIGYLT